MEDFKAILQAFIASEAGIAVQGLVVVAFADFVTGVFAAYRDGTFSADAMGAWIRKHIGGRVGPTAFLLVLSYFGGPAGIVFLAGAVATGATYVAETVASIWGNVNPPKAADKKDTSAAAKLNPIPED